VETSKGRIRVVCQGKIYYLATGDPIPLGRLKKRIFGLLKIPKFVGGKIDEGIDPTKASYAAQKSVQKHSKQSEGEARYVIVL